MVEAVNHYDKDGLIFKTMEDIFNEKYGSKIFGDTLDHFGAAIILEDVFPKLRLDHNLPATLDLIQIEKDVFYTLHFAYYLTPSYKQRSKLLQNIEEIVIQKKSFSSLQSFLNHLGSSDLQ